MKNEPCDNGNLHIGSSKASGGPQAHAEGPQPSLLIAIQLFCFPQITALEKNLFPGP